MGRTSPGSLRPSELRQPCAVCPDSEASQNRVAQRAQVAAGILNIDKPKGLTSHDVVDRVRRASRLRRVGHAGTLDPLATGVLLVLLGPATRLAEYLMTGRKLYRAQVHFGTATETEDAEGRVLSQASIDHLTRADIERVLKTFRGRIQQVPPAYAAIKVDGTPLYRLARRGAAVRVGPRQVDIYRLELLRWDPPRAELEVECSAGTYIRALARDLGEALGCGAHLSGLVRRRSGRFALEDALSLEEVERRFAQGTAAEIVHPLDEALLDYPAWVADAEAERRLRQGQPVAGPPSEGGAVARAYSEGGEFFAVLSYDATAQVWRPRKVLHSDENLS